jgi:hypothetical protein
MSIRRWLVAILSVVVIALGLVPGVASAQSPKREEPSELPFYARDVFGTGEWSVAIFYRPLDCVPEDFNLVEFFDIPGAFACGPMTVDTFAVWEDTPGSDPVGPRQARARGLGAVPIWFVPTDEIVLAESDGVLTVAELEALDPLMGHASFYTETLHPHKSFLVVNARGTLDDGRSFRLHITVNFETGHRVVHVTFGR